MAVSLLPHGVALVAWRKGSPFWRLYPRLLQTFLDRCASCVGTPCELTSGCRLRFPLLHFYLWSRRCKFRRAQLPYKSGAEKLCDRPLEARPPRLLRFARNDNRTGHAIASAAEQGGCGGPV